MYTIYMYTMIGNIAFLKSESNSNKKNNLNAFIRGIYVIKKIRHDFSTTDLMIKIYSLLLIRWSSPNRNAQFELLLQVVIAMYFTRTVVNISDSYVFTISNRVLATVIITHNCPLCNARLNSAPLLPFQEIYCQENMELIDE